MPVSPVFNPQDALRFLPEIILTAMGTLLMVLDPLIHKRGSNAFGHLSLLALAAALGASVYANTIGGPAFGGMLMVDGFATFFRVVFAGLGVLLRQEVDSSKSRCWLRRVSHRYRTDLCLPTAARPTFDQRNSRTWSTSGNKPA